MDSSATYMEATQMKLPPAPKEWDNDEPKVLKGFRQRDAQAF